MSGHQSLKTSNEGNRIVSLLESGLVLDIQYVHGPSNNLETLELNEWRPPTGLLLHTWDVQKGVEPDPERERKRYSCC